MKLNYNVTGSKRKTLVSAISTALNAPTKYLGAPTFAYEVGGYYIDKVGTLTGPDNLDLEDALHQAGFDADGESRHYDEPDTYESGLGGMGALDEFPDAGLVIEMPRSSFTDGALDNLKRLVGSKGSLIKKVLGAETLKFVITDDKVRFPWFKDGTDADAVKAYTHFVAALCEMARVQKRVTAKEKETENDKYAFRCFLLRLGFIGDEYKQERKILLKNLSGSSAFKKGQKKGFSQEDLDKAKADPAVRAEIKAILRGNDNVQ